MKNLFDITIAALLELEFEPAEPQEPMMTFLAEKEGKPLTQATIKWLREMIGDNSIVLVKAFGMTSIEWGGYSAAHGCAGGTLLVAHTEKGVLIDTAFIRSKNARHFDAREERNEARAKLKRDLMLCQRMDRAIDAYTTAYDELKGLLEEEFSIISHAIKEKRLKGKTSL